MKKVIFLALTCLALASCVSLNVSVNAKDDKDKKETVKKEKKDTLSNDSSDKAQIAEIEEPANKDAQKDKK